jgi:hypothetical protein
MPQLSIPLLRSIAYPGQVTDQGAEICRSFSCEAAGYVSGQIVKRGTDKDDQILALAPADVPSFANIAGVIVFSSSKPYEQTPHLVNARVSVLRRGAVYLDFSEAVTAGEEVGVTLATGVLTGVPAGTAAGALATGIVVIPGLRIEQTISAAGVAIVSVNLEGVQNNATVGTL